MTAHEYTKASVLHLEKLPPLMLRDYAVPGLGDFWKKARERTRGLPYAPPVVHTVTYYIYIFIYIYYYIWCQNVFPEYPWDFFLPKLIPLIFGFFCRELYRSSHGCYGYGVP